MEQVREDLIAQLRELKPALQRLGVTRMSLFGSRARNDHRPDSDVDLLIEVLDGKKFSLLDVVGVAQAIEDRLHLSADIFLKRSLPPDFLAATQPDTAAVF